MILAASAQPTSAHARAPPTPRSCCASGSPPIRCPLHESDDPDGIVHRDLRLTLLIFESGLNCSHEGLRFVILHEPLAAVLLPTRIRTNLTSQLDQHRAPRKADYCHVVPPPRTHGFESYCPGESRCKANGSAAPGSRITAWGGTPGCGKAARQDAVRKRRGLGGCRRMKRLASSTNACRSPRRTCRGGGRRLRCTS